MAYSKLTPKLEAGMSSLIECGICLLEMVNPKALPCLHSFCLECLKEVKHPPGIFLCPLCKEKTILPPEGVDGFRDNFVINQIKDIKAITIKGKIRKPCVSCGAGSCEIAARCVDCNGFICQQCVKLHQTIAGLKIHEVFTIEELQSGRFDMSKMMKDENCQKHKDQVLRWFCRTCNISICRDCTVMDHVRPDHDYITIETAYEAQVKEIEALMTSCKGLTQHLTKAITNTEKFESERKQSIENITKKLQSEKKAYLDAIERSYEELVDKLSQIQSKDAVKIDNIKGNLCNKKSKLDNAVLVANQIISSGSKHDLASNYSNLSKTLADLQQVKITDVSKCFGQIIFKPSNESQTKRVDLGSISIKRLNPKDGYGKWVFEKEIGKDGAGKIKGGYGVTVNRNNDIYIADSSEKNVKIFDSDGKFQRVLQGNLKNLCDVVITPNGQYVTDRTGLVHVFNSKGEKVKQFPAISPDCVVSDTDGSELCGLAVDNDGNILVGNNSKYISKHRPDGIHICSFNTNIIPWSIAVTQQGRIIVCPDLRYTNAEILDHNGKLLHTINKPPDAKSWWPWACCCSDGGIVYVTSFRSANDVGVYSFTEDGTYLGCVTTDVICAAGIALIDDDRLVITQAVFGPVKIFCYTET